MLPVLLLSACSGADPGRSSEPSATSSSPSVPAASCDRVVDGVVSVVQRYVDQYGGAAGSVAATTKAPDLPRELRRARATLQDLGCSLEQTSEQLRVGLEDVEADGPLALAVKQQLVASLTGRVDQVATTERVGTDDDLRDVLPELAPGSTVRLAPGEHRLADSVVLLRGITIVGAGRGRTTLTSDAPDAALLALTPDRIDLRDLTMRHVGDQAASLIVGSSSTTLALDGVELAGARAVARGAAKQGRTSASGGSAVLMAGEEARQARTTTLEVTDSVFRDNQASGILLGGRHVASIEDSRFVASGQCGVCFTGDSSGEVRGSRFEGSVTGIIAAGRAAPLLTDSTVVGAEIGVQAVDRATPVIRRTTIRDSTRTAVLFSDRTRGRVEGVTCQGSPYGIVVSQRALPFLGDNSCEVAPTR